MTTEDVQVLTDETIKNSNRRAALSIKEDLEKLAEGATHMKKVDAYYEYCWGLSEAYKIVCEKMGVDYDPIKYPKIEVDYE